MPLRSMHFLYGSSSKRLCHKVCSDTGSSLGILTRSRVLTRAGGLTEPIPVPTQMGRSTQNLAVGAPAEARDMSTMLQMQVHFDLAASDQPRTHYQHPYYQGLP
ncbi:Hypothetical predicted protein [Pelobates cultripes]|uniref:Uncharacterized protein n=1 Tax=Pelobates cultripes TaxID=61616 RepID=A0AAD1TMT7_PELCU|nr:Hypothetical predicted protein [Pelobates cultripes]